LARIGKKQQNVELVHVVIRVTETTTSHGHDATAEGMRL
jgi:hypothetical protein